MDFSLDKSLQILERTPHVLSTWLLNLNEEWIINNEGENTWTVQEVVAHLLLCEKTNWLVRAKIILSDIPGKKFIPIDMVTHLELSKTNSLVELINQFTQQREASIKELKGLNVKENDLKKMASHPTLGEVNLQQLIATWVAHDLSHIAQISRIMAKQYNEHIGPFKTFLKFIDN